MANSAMKRSPLLVAVGAAAGGVEAFTDLLASLSEPLDFAFVFIQHRKSDGDRITEQVLAEHTTLAIVSLEGRTKWQANTVYVCPPQTVLEIKDGFLSILGQGKAEQSHAIDHFFYSVAETQGERGIGVILSGMGSDGTLGLKAISDRGGLTFAQDAESAIYDSMPRSAALTGVADHVMSPAEIAAELRRYSVHLHQRAEVTTSTRQQNQIIEAIPMIAERLLEATNHNFLHYKTNTLSRRIQRRMQVLKIVSVDDYINHLQHHRDETKALFRELLIGVTAFFRDPEAFESLQRNVLPKLLSDRAPDDPARIWIAGCANGAEAYTMAILCREVIDQVGSQASVQIFASDIDERAIKIARAGSYPVGIQQNVSPERLARFFHKRGNRYHVSKDIRDCVLFSTHNLISDPPFSRQDLIVCRNLMIYLGPHLQNKLVPLFHYALRPGGFLFLGPSENITSHAELFRPIDAKHRISQRKGPAQNGTPSLGMRRHQVAPLGTPEPPDEHPVDLTAMAQRILLDEFAPKYAIINASGQIFNLSANLEKYLELESGDYQNNLLKIVHSGLRIGLRSTLGEAVAVRRKVLHDNLSIRTEDLVQRVMLTVQPMPQLGEDDSLFMVVFQDVGLPLNRHQISPTTIGNDSPADELITAMEHELEAVRNDLEKSMQDMEAANEELKSSNEELLSMNEELQSVNEELETSKEEIRAGHDSLAQANDDLQNLLRSTRIATIFLDHDMNIRSFTPAVKAIYDLISADIGRPLERFVPQVYDMPPLPELQTVYSLAIESTPTEHSQGDLGHFEISGFNRVTPPSIEHTIRAHSGKSYIRRVLPYQSQNGSIEGIVVTFTDVSELRDNEHRFRTTFENAAVGIAHVALDGRWLRVNNRLCDIVGYHRDQLLQKTFQDITHPDDLQGDLDLMNRLVAGEINTYSMEKRYIRSTGEPVWVNLTVSFNDDSDGSAGYAISVIEDIDEKVRNRQALIASEELVRTIAENSTEALVMMNERGYVTYCNQAWLAMTGYDADEIRSKPLHDLVHHHHPDGRPYPMADCPIDRALPEDFSVRSHEDLFFRKDGTTFDVLCAASPIFKDGKPISTVLEVRDVTEQRAAARNLLESQQRLDLALTAGRLGVWQWDIVNDELTWSSHLYDLFGYAPDNFAGTMKGFLDVVHPDDREKVQHIIQSSLDSDSTRYQLDCRIVRGDDGSIVWTHVLGAIERDRKGRPLRILGVSNDDTDRKQRELDLADREAHLSRVIDNTLGLIGVLDTNGRVVEINKTALEAGGVTRDEVIGVHAWDCSWWNFDDRVRQQFIDTFARAMNGETVRFDTVIRMVGDSRMTIDFMLVPVRDHEGNTTHLIASGIDITDRKAAEAKVLESQRKLQLGIVVAAFALGEVDYDANTIDLSPEAALLFGIGDDAITVPRQKIHALFHPDDRVRVEEKIDQCLDPEGDQQIAVEHRIILPDGTVRWLDVRKRVFFDDTVSPPKPVRGTLVARDVTHDKLVQTELIENRQRLNLAMESARMGAFQWEPESDTAHWDEQWCDVIGVDRDAPQIGRTFFDVVHPEDLDNLKSVMLRGADQREQYKIEFRIIHRDGKLRWLAASGVHLPGQNGQPSRIVGLNWDITEQKEAAERIRQGEEQLRLAMNAAKLSLWEWNIVEDKVSWASKIYDHQALEQAASIGGLQDFLKLVHPHDRNSVQTAIEKCLVDGEPYHAEFRMRRADGGYRWVLSMAHLSIDNNGLPLRLVGVELDTTERQEIERLASEHSKRLAMALRAGDMAAWEWTPEGSVWTDEVYEILGVPNDQLASAELFFRSVHPDDLDGLKASWDKATSGHESLQHEFRVILPDGEIRWVVAVGEVVRDENEQVVSLYGLNWDSTEEHLTAERLRESERAAIAASASKSAFVANMSHEIRTPMTAILGYAELLGELVTSDNAKQYLDTIRRNGDYLLEIINDILDLSKIEAGKLDIEHDRFQPTRVLEDVLSIMEVRAREGGLALELELDGNIPTVIQSDAKRLKQILINLVGNAIKFTRKGKVTIRVYYSEPVPDVETTGFLHFDVIDTGIGMSVEQQERLFKPFSQGDPAVNRHFGGTGLGLAISLRLAKMLGGEITVHSTEGVGSTFAAKIATGDLSDIELPNHQEPVPPTYSQSETNNSPEKTPELDCRVLVIDDRRDIRLLSKTLLMKAGATIDECEDGQLAVEHMTECIGKPNCPDLILLDMQMPKLDGYSTARALRKLGYSGPIVALTADAMQGDMNECLQAGCDDYLSKPIDAAKLLRLVCEMTSRSGT
jgi:PAS domain S-box-containing protein